MERDQPTRAAPFPHVRLCGAHNDEEDRLGEPINEEFTLPILVVHPRRCRIWLRVCVPLSQIGAGLPMCTSGMIDRFLVRSSRPKKPETALTITWHWCCDAVDKNVSRSEDMPTKQHSPRLRLRWPILDVAAHHRASFKADLEVATSRANNRERLGIMALGLHPLSVFGLIQTRHSALW